MKRILTCIALSAACLASLNAQVYGTQYAETPHYYLGVKGGAQGVFTNYDFDKLLTPSVGVMAGMQFNRVFGARLDVEGLWSKTAFVSADETMKYKYVTTDLDLTMNLTNIFLNYEHLVDWSLVLGGGYNYSWDTSGAADFPMEDRCLEEHESLHSHNFRVGTILGFNCSRQFAINLEVDANNVNDKFNSKKSDSFDWQMTAMVGVQYRFGHRKVKTQRSVVQYVEYCRSCGLPLNQCAYYGNHPVVQQQPAVHYTSPDQIRIEIFFSLNKDEMLSFDDAQLRGLRDYILTHQYGTVMVNAYADRKTGNPKYNQALSQRRAETVVRALQNIYGIPAYRIESRAFGDKVQPYKVNEHNRVVIIDIKEAE